MSFFFFNLFWGGTFNKRRVANWHWREGRGRNRLWIAAQVIRLRRTYDGGIEEEACRHLLPQKHNFF